MIKPDEYVLMLIGVIIIVFVIYTWNQKASSDDEWRNPMLLIAGIFIILLGFVFIIYDIYTDQLKTDSKFFYTAVISVSLGGFTVYTAYSKRKDEMKNAWRIPLVFVGGIVLIMFGAFLLGVMFFSIRYASLFVGVVGIIEILISLKISHTKNSIKWLFSLTLIGGLITFVFGIFTYFLFTSSII